MTFGERPHRALIAPTPRSYSFYMHVPDGGSLTFAYGAAAAVEFRVAVHTDGDDERVLFRETATPDAWRDASVDLSEVAGRAVRLDLITSGPDARAGWGLPAVRTTTPAPERRRIASRPKHVVLVVYDTTRADTFAAHDSDTRVKTPHYDALAERATAFTRAYNNEAWTRPSTATIVTGLYPDTHRAVYARDVLSDDIEFLSEHLKEHGFATAAVLGNSVLGDKFGFNQGFDYYVNDGRTDDSADNIFGKSIAWIEQHHEQPLFLWIQSHDSHTPFEVDRKYSEPYYPGDYRGFIGSSFSKGNQVDLDKGRRKASDDDLAWARALYDGEATYQDEGFGKLIAKLDELGILDDTLILVTNDHGEEFGEHGGWGHGWTQHEEMLRAPLLVHYPPVFPQGASIDDIVEHVDIAPTIVALLGLPPMSNADGLSFAPLVTGRPIDRPRTVLAGLRDSQRTIVVGRWKLIVDSKGRRNSLYDLTADPGEAKNRAADAPIAGRLCEVYLGEALAVPRKPDRLADLAARRRFQTAPAKLDRATKRELESLGYLGDGAPE
jgi:arylsulfatase A-like enzyme